MATRDLILRPPVEADYDAMGQLHAAAYPALGLSPAERARRIHDDPRIAPHQRIVADLDGQLVGMYSLLRLDVWLGGKPVPTGGLAGVAVAPHARGSGTGTKLVEHALATCLEEHRPVCILYPFREDFYHRLGFATVYELRRCRFSAAWLPLFEERRRVRHATVADLPRLQRCYAEFCRRTNGTISRDEAYFRQLVLGDGDRHVVIVPRAAGKGAASEDIDGYLIWRYEAPYDEHQVLEVVELVQTEPTAYRALLGHLATQRDQVREVRYDVAPDDPFTALLVRNSSIPAPQLRSLHQDLGSNAAGAMMRIVDLPAALLSRGRFGDGTLALRIAGQAPLRLTVQDGQPRLEEDDGSGAALATDSRTMARIYAGTLCPSEAVRLGLAEVNGDLESADRLFKLPRPLLLDVF
jgi:predicted acetyltransferase